MYDRSVPEGAGPVRLRVRVSDVVANWEVFLIQKGPDRLLGEGWSDQPGPFEAHLPAGQLQQGEVYVTWFVTVYGPAKKHDYAISLTLEDQAGEAIGAPILYEGELAANQVEALSGAMRIVEAS